MTGTTPQTTHRPDLTPGLGQIGDYSLLERLGVGGMGEVWLARRETSFGDTNKVVALKLMAAKLCGSTEAQRLFRTEARLAMMLSHSNIVQVFDVGQTAERAYMAMEWVDGVDLESVIRYLHTEERELGSTLAAYIIGEVLEALSYAHGLVEDGVVETVVHRDISPHNLLTSVSGEVKLTDFGIARLHSEETSGLHVRGKLRYMPPEQLNGVARHPAVDLFATGAVFYELLSGLSFRGEVSPDELFTAVASGHVPQTDLPGLPYELRLLLDRLLESDSRRRLQSASEGLEILRSWPQYRSCRAELAELVREISGIEGPRSGLSIPGQAVIAKAIELDTATLTRLGPSAEQARPEAPEPSDPDAQTAVEVVPEARSLEPEARLRTSAKRRSSAPVAWLAGLVTGVLLLVGLAGLGGLALARDSADDPRPNNTAANRLPAADGHEAAGSARVRHELLPLTRADPDPRQALATPTRSRGPARTRRRTVRDDAMAPKPKPKPKPDALAPATVTFTSGEFLWLAVKVSGKQLDLDPRARTTLPAGRHRVAMRVGGGKWQLAGELELEPGQRYRVDFLQPSSFRARELGTSPSN